MRYVTHISWFACLLFISIGIGIATNAKAAAGDGPEKSTGDANPTTVPTDAIGARELMPTVRAFVRAIGESKDEKAYELTNAAYQKAHPGNEFASKAAAFRQKADFTKHSLISGLLTAKSEKAEGLPRAVAVVRLELPREQRHEKGQAYFQIGIEMVRTGDKWVIAEFNELTDLRAVSAFKREFSRNEDRLRAFSNEMSGKVTKVENGSVTIDLESKSPNFVAVPLGQQTFALEDKTVVNVASVDASRVIAGRTLNRYHVRLGTIADVKAGMMAIAVELSDDNKRIESITIIAGNGQPADAQPGL
jgi:hypothetical protein